MSKAAGKKAAKKGVNMAAETADAIVKTALALFGGDLACDPDYHGTLSFRGAPFAIPGEDQLRLIGAEMGSGNDLPAPQAFAADARLWRRGHRGDALPETAREKRVYSFACRPCDRIYMAVQVIFALHIRRGVRKFIVTVRSLTEREQVRQAMEVYSAHFAEGYRLATPVIRVYDSADLNGLKGYITAEGIGILLINRENFDRDANLLRRQSVDFSDHTPLSLIRAAKPVVVTLTNDAKPLSRLLNHTTQFAPLCTLSFMDFPDPSGTTCPVYTGLTCLLPEEDNGQIRLDTES